MRQVRETIGQALVQPHVPRVFAHLACGGWVIFRLEGGWCLSCGAGPVPPGQYAKPAEAARAAA